MEKSFEGAGGLNFGFDGILGEEHQYSDDEEEIMAAAELGRLTKIHS